MSSFHSTSLKFARASSLQCTAHLIFILASVSSQGWQTPRGAASKVSISVIVSSSPCLSSSSFDLTSCWARSSSHCWTSSGVSGLSVFIAYRWHLRLWGTVLLSGNGVARVRRGRSLVTLGGDAGHAGEMPAHAGERLLTLGTPGYAGGRLGHAGERLLTLRTPGYTGGRLGHAGECLLTLGMPGYAGGRLGHAGECLAHAGDAWLRWGTPGSRWGTPCSRWGPLATLGDAWVTLGNALLMLGTPGSRWGTPCSRWGTPGVTLILDRFSGVGVPRGPLCLSSVIEVKYASRGPPYIAGSELLSRVFWCESQLLIGSSRSMSTRETPECLGRFDVRNTFNPCCIIRMCGMCHPKFTARLSRASSGQAP